ncbi:MAG: hypothetical protein AB7I30_17210 [Isosphaeraceae bacterium]
MEHPGHRSDSQDEAKLREIYWSRRLGRIRLRAEPVTVQLERYRQAAVILSAVAGGIGLVFIALFSAFRQPMVGIALALLLMGPLILINWVDFWKLQSRVNAYLREVGGEGEPDANRPPGDSSPNPPAA